MPCTVKVHTTADVNSADLSVVVLPLVARLCGSGHFLYENACPGFPHLQQTLLLSVLARIKTLYLRDQLLVIISTCFFRLSSGICRYDTSSDTPCHIRAVSFVSCQFYRLDLAGWSLASVTASSKVCGCFCNNFSCILWKKGHH